MDGGRCDCGRIDGTLYYGGRGEMLVGKVLVLGLALSEHGSGSCRDAILRRPSVP